MAKHLNGYEEAYSLPAGGLTDGYMTEQGFFLCQQYSACADVICFEKRTVFR